MSAAVDTPAIETIVCAGVAAFISELPAAWYVMPASVVIPAGQAGVDITIPINTNNYVTGQTYAIPLTITSTSQGTISGNFGAIIVAVAAQ